MKTTRSGTRRPTRIETKRVPFGGTRAAEIRVEGFNIFDRVNLGVPVTDFSSSSFGRIQSTATSAREFQFGVKVRFLVFERPLEPGDVPVLVELASHGMKHADRAKPEPLVQRDRSRIRQAHACHDGVNVLVFQ